MNATPLKPNASGVLRQGRFRLVPLALDGFGPQTGPALGPIRAMHRGPDGFVAFAQKRGDDWRSLGAMPLNEPWLPELVAHLEQNSYFGLNSDFRAGYQAYERRVWRPVPGEPRFEAHTTELVKRRTNPATGLRYAHHATGSLRWLNVAHVDVDCYRVGLDVPGALAEVLRLQDAAQLPPATGFARSGRGLWCFWFLLDALNPQDGERQVYGVTHRPDTPQRATTMALAVYARVQHALADKLKPLGADMGALDAARFAPVPGSLKTATNQRVEYWVQGAGGHGFAYTLQQLVRELHLDVPSQPRVVVEAFTEPTEQRSARGRKGWLARVRYALRDVELLMRLRGGGFPEGCRNKGAFFYALLLARAGMALPDVTARVADFGAHCRPPLEPRAVRDAVKASQKTKRLPSHDTLFWQLAVTDKEASYLTHVKPAGTVPAGEPLRGRRGQDARRAAILALVQKYGPLSSRAMTDFLAPLGFTDNHTTVWRDCKALGLNTPQNRGGRPKTSLPF